MGRDVKNQRHTIPRYLRESEPIKLNCQRQKRLKLEMYYIS